MAKRIRSDSTKAAVRAQQEAALPPIEPPRCATLRPQDQPYWDAIITARARHTWTDADLLLAASLARAYTDMQELQELLDREGLMQDGKVHPARGELDRTTRRAMAMSRQLMVATIATVGKAADMHNAATLERKARQQADDPLIPRLRAV